MNEAPTEGQQPSQERGGMRGWISRHQKLSVATLSLTLTALGVLVACLSLFRDTFDITLHNPFEPAGGRSPAVAPSSPAPPTAVRDHQKGPDSAQESAVPPLADPPRTTPPAPVAKAPYTDNTSRSVSGEFENVPATTSGCLGGLGFVVNREPPADKTIWIMAYSTIDKKEVYPERRLDFTAGQARVAPFPVGSAEDPNGTTFEVIAILLDIRVSNRYENAATTTQSFPVESAIPSGEILDTFSISRGRAYDPCE